MDILESVKKYKIISILRGIMPSDMKDTVKALYDGGIRLLEITFDQRSETKIKDTVQSIKIANELGLEGLKVGAGTVMSIEEVNAAYTAGAEFILAPNVDISVIKEAKSLGIGAIPGALTPSEVAVAYGAGADIVKLFPAGDMGLGYCKAIMAPINNVPLLAVGGVNEKNIKDFFDIGFVGAGIGSNIAKRDLIINKKFNELTALAKEFLKIIEK